MTIGSKKSTLIVGVVVGMAVAVSAAAVAQQGTAPAVPTAAPAPAVVAPVVPAAPAQNPGALAAIEKTVTAPTATVPVASGTAPAVVPSPAASAAAGYIVPPAGPGIFQGSDQTLREIAFLATEVALNEKRKERLDSIAELKEAEQGLTAVNAGRPRKSDSGSSSMAPPNGALNGPLPTGPMAAPGSAPATSVVLVSKPEPFVNSVYGYNGQMYAEMVLGSTKILATKGTVLTDGSRVISVSNSAVTIATKRGTKKLAIRGSAGY